MKPPIAWRLLAGIAAGLGIAWPGPGARQPEPRQVPRFPNPALSAPYLPVSFEVDGPKLAAFTALMSRARLDSTRNWRFRNGRVRLSFDLMQDLAGGGLPAGSGRMGEKLAAILAAKGLSLEAPASAHAQYLPDDDAVADASQWPFRNTGEARGGRPGQPGLDIGIEKVWDKFSGSDTLVLADLDAGWDFAHPEMKGRNWVNRAEAKGAPGVDDDANGFVDDSIGWDFVENDNDPQDYMGHGLMTGSVMAAGFDNHFGVAGMLPKVRIMPVRVLDASGHGDESGIAKGILYAVRNGAKAINFSIGGSSDNKEMRAAFQAARDAGVPIIVAAGNNGIDLNAHPAYPASYTFDNMLVVAAHDHAGLLCGFSNYGRTAVHLAAPGEFVPACDLPKHVYIWGSTFETDASDWNAAGTWRLTRVNPLEMAQSYEWVSGEPASITSADTLDLVGKKGAILVFGLNYRGANPYDGLIVEGRKAGESAWIPIAGIGGQVDSTEVLTFGLHDFDGSRFQLRFRTTLAARYSTAGRVLKIDNIWLRIPNPDPPAEPAYLETSGTSVAAPFVTAYVGLMRLACDRMGVPFTRALALAGVDSAAALAGKVSTNGRLDCYKGLKFYLETLPDLRVTDSAAVAWKVGDKIEYALNVDPASQAPYAFSVSGLPDGLAIDGAGKLVWTPNGAQAGSYTARFLAEGPSTLRKLVRFRIDPLDPDPVPVARFPAYAPEWVLGGRRFFFPPGMESGRHLIEISAADAAGRIRTVVREWIQAPARAPLPRAAGTVPAGFHGWQVRADGVPLASSR